MNLAGVTPGQESVNAKQAGMVQYVHDHVHSTHMEKDAATCVTVRMMPSVHQ